LEDAHWGDPTTLELLGQVLDRIAGARALVLLTSRPENQPSLGGQPNVTRLTLNRLGRAPIEAIVARLASDRVLPPGLLSEHALVRDAAHESLLKAERQRLHARIARTLEKRFPETLGAEPELLAGHFAEAGLAERAAHHWLRAAEPAISRSANVEAIAHC